MQKEPEECLKKDYRKWVASNTMNKSNSAELCDSEPKGLFFFHGSFSAQKRKKNMWKAFFKKLMLVHRVSHWHA